MNFAVNEAEKFLCEITRMVVPAPHAPTPCYHCNRGRVPIHLGS